MRFCQLMGAEPYLSVNTTFLGANQAGHWVEYCNGGGNTYWAQKRREHGHPKPWNVHYWNIGNESYWRHSPADYLQQYRLWKHFMRNADPSIIIVSSGLEPNWRPDPWGRDDWGTWFIKETRADMDQYSIHTYFSAGDAVNFSDEEYYKLFAQLWRRLPRSISATAGLLDAHSALPRETGIAIDEWGIWHPGHTAHPHWAQPGTLRDALFAAGFFHICHAYADRVAMATIAQTLNVLHALINTEGERMVRTPTYHVFDMYQGHMGAQVLDVAVSGVQHLEHGQAGMRAEASETGQGEPIPLAGEEKLMPPLLWASATRRPGTDRVTLSVINLSLDEDVQADVRLHGKPAGLYQVRGQVLTAPSVRSQNTFENANYIVPSSIETATSCGPAFARVFLRHSVTVLSLSW